MLNRHPGPSSLSDAIVIIPTEVKDDAPKNEVAFDEIHTTLSGQRVQDTVLQCDDLMQYMFTFMEMCDKVKHLPLVNKTFNRACKNSASWHTVWINEPNPVAMFMAFAHRMPRLHALRLDYFKDGLAPLLRHAMVHCPALSKVYGTDIHFGLHTEREIAVEMLKAFPKLCTLNLRKFPLLNGIWMDGDGGMFHNIIDLRIAHRTKCQAPHDMLACFPALEAYSGPVDNELLHAMAVHCPSLRVLKCPYPDTGDYVDGYMAILRSVGHQLVHLTVSVRLCEIGPLIAEHCCVLECLYLREFEEHTLSDDVLADILTRVGPTLRVLELKKCLTLTNQAAVLIGAQCPRLVDLQWYNATNVDNEGLRAIAEGCPLQRLHIEGSDATLEGFEPMPAQCRSLLYMSIGNIVDYDEAVCQSFLLDTAAQRIALQLAPVELYFYMTAPNSIVYASVGDKAHHVVDSVYFCDCVPAHFLPFSGRK
jgi:hypothetical protein